MKANYPTQIEIFRIFFIPLKEAPIFFRSLKNVLMGALTLYVLSVFSPPARATGFSLGDADNYVVLYSVAGNNTLSMNNETVNGNVGIGNPTGNNPQVQLNGPLDIS